VAIEQPEIKKPIEPKPVGEIANPVPALLVFTGKPGGPHKLADFKPLAKAGKHLSRATRKLVAHLLPAENVAWNADAVRSGGKLAANTDDISTTGSVNRAGNGKGSRAR
jgi:hypothetical protein